MTWWETIGSTLELCARALINAALVILAIDILTFYGLAL